MTQSWSYTHQPAPPAAIRTAAEMIVSAPPPPSLQWAADLAAKMRLAFAQQCQAYPGRITNIGFTVSVDSSGSLTMTLTAS